MANLSLGGADFVAAGVRRVIEQLAGIPGIVQVDVVLRRIPRSCGSKQSTQRKNLSCAWLSSIQSAASWKVRAAKVSRSVCQWRCRQR